MTGEAANVHATAVRVGDRGVLIRGASGSGKSSLALALIDAAPSDAVLIADDRVLLAANDGRLVASAPAPIAGMLEVRGVGLLAVDHVSPAPIDLVVDLLPLADCPRLPVDAEAVAVVEGVALPRIWVASGAVDGAARVRAALRWPKAEKPGERR